MGNSSAKNNESDLALAYNEFAIFIVNSVKQRISGSDIQEFKELTRWNITRNDFVKTYLPVAPSTFSPYNPESWRILIRHLQKHLKHFGTDTVGSYGEFCDETWRLELGSKPMFTPMEFLALKVWAWSSKVPKINFEVMVNWKDIPASFRPHVLTDWQRLYHEILECKEKYDTHKFKWDVTFNENERDFIFTKFSEETEGATLSP